MRAHSGAGNAKAQIHLADLGRGVLARCPTLTMGQNDDVDTIGAPGKVVRVMLASMLMAGLLLVHAEAATQDDPPRPPCGMEASFPAYPAEAAPGNAPALVRAWQEGGLPRWTPPACTGWTSNNGQGFRTLVALAGRITLPQGSGAGDLLGRFAAVSKLRSARYWSVSDGAWRPLVTDASALDDPNRKRRRPDFSASELADGRDAYFVQDDGRSPDGVVYRLRVRESGPDRLVVQIENFTPVRLLVVTLFEPGALQAVYFLQRLSPMSWGYYSLSRTTKNGSSSLAVGHEASYVNRAAAVYRFIAGASTDHEPPLAR